MSASPRDNVLAAYLRPQSGRVVILAALLVGGVSLQVLSPIVIRQFIDTAARGGAHAPLNVLWFLAAVFIAAAIFTQLLQVAATYYGEQVGWAATNQMRRDLAAHCLHLDMAFHTARTPGELLERVDGDVAALATFFSQFVLQIVGGALLLVGILVVLFFEDARVGAAMTLFAALALAAMYLCRDLAREHFEAERQAWSELAGFLEERLSGLDDVRANGGGGYVVGRLGAFNQALTERGVAAGRRGLWIYLITGAVFAIGFAASLGLGAYLYLHGRATIGAVFMFVQFTAMMGDPLVRIGQQLQQFQAAAAGLTRVRALTSFLPSVQDGPGLGWDKTRAQAPRVDFNNVRFAYTEGVPVIDGVNLHVAPGQVLGLLGRTGSGKSTLTRLLFRLYDLTGGSIALDGEDISRARLIELRARIGLVTQDVQLFEASVRDNATMFDDSISDARVADVLGELGLGPWLARQPHGLDTILIGAGGLSSGEAQLLAFARVFLKNPGLVVLDEASSRLDPTTDRLIEHAMDRLLHGGDGASPRTAIIIAHKLSTVRRADAIVILDKGRVLESGSRLELAADPGSHFARLLRYGLEDVLA